MVRAREARDEQRDELVTRELVDDAVPDVDGGGRLGVEACHQAAELLCADASASAVEPRTSAKRNVASTSAPPGRFLSA